MSAQTEKSSPPPSVAKRVLARFVEAVADEKDLKDVSVRLEKLLLGDERLTEVAFRQVLFGDDEQ